MPVSKYYYECPRCGYGSDNDDDFIFHDEDPRYLSRDELWRFIAPTYRNDVLDMFGEKTRIVAEIMGWEEREVEPRLFSMSTLELHDVMREIRLSRP